MLKKWYLSAKVPKFFHLGGVKLEMFQSAVFRILVAKLEIAEYDTRETL